MAVQPSDYYLITSRRGEYPDRWSWEIYRKSSPLGIKMTGDGFQSEMAAELPGNARLRIFYPNYRRKKNGSKAASVGGLFHLALRSK
jgi:hypothetical protein